MRAAATATNRRDIQRSIARLLARPYTLDRLSRATHIDLSTTTKQSVTYRRYVDDDRLLARNLPPPPPLLHAATLNSTRLDTAPPGVQRSDYKRMQIEADCLDGGPRYFIER